MEVSMLQLPPGDPGLIDKIVCQLKSNGIFDQFRKECIADVDTKPAYQNLRQRVEGSVSSFLTSQEWRADLNKNQLRDSLRKHIHECGFLDIGVERIVDQVVNPKMYTVFFPKVEDVVYGFLGVEKPRKGTDIHNSMQSCTPKFEDIPKPEKKFISLKDLLPTDLDPISPEKLDSDEDIEENTSDKIKINDVSEVERSSVQKFKVKEEVASDAEHDFDEDEKEDEEEDDDEASPPFESLEADAVEANSTPPILPLHSADMLDNITSSSSSSETKDLLQYGEVRKRYPDPKSDSFKKELDGDLEKCLPPEQIKAEIITETFTVKKEEKEKKEMVEPKTEWKKIEKKEEKARDNGERKDEVKSRKTSNEVKESRDKHVHDKKRSDRDQVSVKVEKDDSKKEEQRKTVKEEHKKSERDDHRKGEKDESKRTEKEKDESRKSEKGDKKHGEKEDNKKVEKEKDSSRRHDRDKEDRKNVKERDDKRSDKDKKYVREKEEGKRSDKDDHRKSEKDKDESRRSDKERSEGKKRDKKDEKKPEREKDEKKVEKEKDERKPEKEKDDKKTDREKDERKVEKEKDDKKTEREKDERKAEKEKDDKKTDREKDERKAEKEKDDKKTDREKDERKAEKERDDKKTDREKDERKVEKEKDDKKTEKEKDERKSDKEKDDKKTDREKDERKAEKEKDDKKTEREKDERKAEKEKDDKKIEREKDERKAEKEKDDKKIEREKDEKKTEREKEEKKVVKEKDDSKRSDKDDLRRGEKEESRKNDKEESRKNDKEESRKNDKEETRKSDKEKDKHRSGKERSEHTKGEKDVKERIKSEHKEKDSKHGLSKSSSETKKESNDKDAKKESSDKNHHSKVAVDKKKEDSMKKPHHRDSSKSSSSRDKKVGEKEKKVNSSDDHRHERDKGKNGHRRSDRDKDRERERSQADGATQAAVGKEASGQSSSTSSTPSSSSDGSKGSGDSGGGGSDRTKEEGPKMKAGAEKEEKKVKKSLKPSDMYSSINNCPGNLVLKIKKPKIAANIYEVKKIIQVRKNLKKLERERLVLSNAYKASNQKADEVAAESTSTVENLTENKSAPEPPKVKRAKLGAVEQDLRGEVESVLEKSLLEGEDGEIGEVLYLEENPSLSDFVLYVRSLAEEAAAGDYSRIPSPTNSIATIELSDFDDCVILSDVELSKEDEKVVTKLGGHVERKANKLNSPKKSSLLIPSSDTFSDIGGEGSNKRPRRPNPRYNSGEYTVYSDEELIEGDMTESVSQKKVTVVDGIGHDHWKTPKDRSSEVDEEVDAISRHETGGAALPMPENDARSEDRETPVLSKRNQAAAEERRRLGRRLGVRGPMRRAVGISPGTPDTFVMPLSPESDVSTASGDTGKKASLNSKAIENQYHQGDMDGELGPEDYEDVRGSEGGEGKHPRLPLGPPLTNVQKGCDIKSGDLNQSHEEIGHPSSELNDGERRIDDPGLGPRRLRGTRSSVRVQQRYSSDDLYKPRPNITLGRRNRGRNSPTQEESPAPVPAHNCMKQGRRGSNQGSDGILVEGCMPNKRRRRYEGTPPEAEVDDYQSPPTNTLTVKKMNEAFTYLEQFLSIMEENDPNAERSSQVRRAVNRDTACYRLLYQEKKKASVQLSLDKFFKKVNRTPSASTSSQR